MCLRMTCDETCRTIGLTSSLAECHRSAHQQLSGCAGPALEFRPNPTVPGPTAALIPRWLEDQFARGDLRVAALS